MNVEEGQIKLLHIMYSGQGGVGTYFTNFVRMDKKKRFEHFAFFYGIEPIYPEYQEFCETHDIPFKYFQRIRKVDLKAFKACRLFIKEHQIKKALLHTFSLTPFNFWFKNNIKVISIDHTPYQVKTSVEWLFSALNHMFAFKSVYFYEQQFMMLMKRFPFLYQGRNTHFIPKTVDLNLFVPPAHEFKVGSPFVIGTTARIIRGKRHVLLIEAMENLITDGYEIKLRIAGEGPESENCKELVEKKKLSKQVEFVGALDVNEIVTFYQTLDAYIHASDGETVCYCIMEAQACALPIIASNVDGIRNAIVHERDGLLFENNVASISEMITRLASDTLALENQGKRGRLLAELSAKKNDVVQEIYKMILLSEKK